MTGSQCDNCKKIQSQSEYLRPTMTNTNWFIVKKKADFHSLDFCSKECLIKYIENNPNF